MCLNVNAVMMPIPGTVMSAFQVELHLTEQFVLRSLYASGVSSTGLTFLVTSRLSRSTTILSLRGGDSHPRPRLTPRGYALPRHQFPYAERSFQINIGTGVKRQVFSPSGRARTRR